MQITTENLIENLPNLGGWSLVSLAEEALKHYFPNEFDEDGDCETKRLVQLTKQLGCSTWVEVIEKYHTEVGYVRENGIFDLRELNEN